MTSTHTDYRLSQLDQLEAESIHIFREVAAEFERPVLLFSGGKDSIVMLRLAEKAFYPARIPFPVMQIDTGYDFPEVVSTRDKWVSRLGVRLIVASVEDAIKNGIVIDDGKTSRNRLQIGTLLNATRRRPAPRSASTPTATSSASGTRRTSAPSCGTSTTAACTRASTCGSSRSPTGPSWTSGTTSARSRS
jgi:3'-phosphoadenosine 5'-phosphosulfate sulfotransferase (PAPS reductase)/FAD synthetase